MILANPKCLRARPLVFSVFRILNHIFTAIANFDNLVQIHRKNSLLVVGREFCCCIHLFAHFASMIAVECYKFALRDEILQGQCVDFDGRQYSNILNFRHVAGRLCNLDCSKCSRLMPVYLSPLSRIHLLINQRQALHMMIVDFKAQAKARVGLDNFLH
jgi:hypothetical protein